MIPTQQTILHDPDNGLHGNCFAATLASLSHLTIEEIPSFTNPYSWKNDLNHWLRQYHLAYIEIANFPEVCEDHSIKDCYCEVSGVTPRSPKVLHATVGIDGKSIYDPHPTQVGLTGPTTTGIFIALQPWLLTHPPAVKTQREEEEN